MCVCVCVCVLHFSSKLLLMTSLVTDTELSFSITLSGFSPAIWRVSLNLGPVDKGVAQGSIRKRFRSSSGCLLLVLFVFA